MRILSPAKINLRLKVEGRRSDGYHLLSMLNVFCDFFDEIEIEKKTSPGVSLEVSSNDPMPDKENNTAYKAGIKFIESFNIHSGLDISLNKRIPTGAGLGGGSGNAGSVLKALSSEFLKEKNHEVLLKIAEEIGSDVPFFLSSGLALVKGRGEIIEDIKLDFLKDVSFILVLPKIHVSTAEVFKELRTYSESRFSEDVFKLPKDYTALLDILENDLEEIAINVSKPMGEILRRLKSIKGLKASMSGSGSSVFLLNKTNSKVSPADFDSVREALQGCEAEIRESRFAVT